MKIRALNLDDELLWRALWDDYNQFYQTKVAQSVTDATWRRILDPTSSISGRAVELDDQIVGFCHFVLHEGTWTARHICYLEDLFVARPARSTGLGRALVEDLIAQCKLHGWSRLYWHTRRDNQTARALYDQFVKADEFVRYRLIFE